MAGKREVIVVKQHGQEVDPVFTHGQKEYRDYLIKACGKSEKSVIEEHKYLLNKEIAIGYGLNAKQMDYVASFEYESREIDV